MAADEKQLAGANYVLNFYNEVQQLTHTSTQFFNIIKHLKDNYGEQNISKMSEPEKAVLNQTQQNVLFFVRNTYIYATSLIDAISANSSNQVEIPENLEPSYKKLWDSVILNRDDLDNYVKAINSFLTKDVIKSILQNSQDFVNEVYSE